MKYFITKYYRAVQKIIEGYFSVFLALTLFSLLVSAIQDHLWITWTILLGTGLVSIITISEKKKWITVCILLLIGLFRVSPDGPMRVDSQSLIASHAKVIWAKQTPLNLRVLVRLPDQTQAIVIVQKSSNEPLPVNGTLVQLKGQWQVIPVIRNPGEFDYRAYLKLNHISGTIIVSEWSIIRESPWWWVPGQAAKTRQWITRLHRQALKQPYADLLGSFIFGDYGIALPSDISTQFQVLGLTHLLVVSGAQVALISGFLTLLLQLILPGYGWVVGIITLVNIGFYFLTGAGTSILRAIVMLEISLIISLNFRQSHWSNKVGLTAIILLLIRPESALDIGAQLSFLATIALLYLAPIIANRIPKTMPKWAGISIATSIATFLLTIPISIFNFNQISWISLPANIVVVVIAEWVVIIGFIATILGSIALPISIFLFSFCQFGLILILKLTQWFITLQPIPFHIRKPPILLLLMYYGSATLIFMPIGRSIRRKTALIGSTVLVGSIWIFNTGHAAELPLEMTFLDVGQGDATLINNGYRQYVVVDFGDRRFTPTSGGPSIRGGRVVEQALRSKGSNKIDWAIVTHLHKDHYGGLSEVAKQFPIGMLLINRKSDRHLLNHYLKIRALQVQNQYDTRTIFLSDDTQLKILHPVKELPIDSNENNNSIVIQVQKNQFSVLLTGDLEADRENWLRKTYGAQLKSLVLKVGHHGSLTSSSDSFLSCVQPKIAVISCGQSNRYHHPRPQTLKRLQNHHIKIYRTDTDGAITIKTNGQKYNLSTQKHSKKKTS